MRRCPILKMKTESYDADGCKVETVEPQDCIEEDCAFYDEEKNCCSVKVIAKELSRIQVKGINVQVAR